MIKTGIDISSLIYNRGVSRYTSNLVRALLKRKDVQLSLYGSSLRQKNILEIKIQRLLAEKNAKKATVEIQSWPPSVLTWLWRFGFNPVKKNLPKIDLFHSWDWLQPPDKNLPLVSTIHDLAILKFPQTAHPSILKAHQRSWDILKKRQAQVIAVSHATKKDIINLLQIPAWQITVVHEAMPAEVEMMSNSLAEEEYLEIKRKLELTKPFILFVGTREPRKNLKRLIKAWRPLAKDFQLIIAGKIGWDETSSKGKIPDNPNLLFLGQVADSELAVLYGEAELFAYPSLYEGFGLPILEAFYHGTPVLTANVNALIEVAGNAAEYIEPQSVESIRTGLEKVLNENKSAQQKRLQRMIIRLQMFSWEKVAEETMKVYQRALS